MLRSDPPSEIFYPVKEAILPNERYLVCRRNGSQEIVIQSDRDPDRAQHSVDVLNEHEERNARPANHYWRLRKEGECRT
jgi:hypothetical protein